MSERAVNVAAVRKMAPGIYVSQTYDVRRQVAQVDLVSQFDRHLKMTRESIVGGGPEYATLCAVEAVRSIQQAAITALGLEAWRDEHERELEAKAKRERLELVRSLYAAARTATSLESVQLLLADELEAWR